MAINENTTLEAILAASIQDAGIYFNDWDRAEAASDEFGKTKAHGQIDATLRIVRRIDAESFDMLRADRLARLGNDNWTDDLDK